MCARVITLHEGYLREPSPKRYEAGCSTLLIQIGEAPLVEQLDPSVIPQMAPVRNILFEAAGPWEAESLVAKLAENGVTPGDIDLVLCSHGHSDHVGCLSLFPKGNLVTS